MVEYQTNTSAEVGPLGSVNTPYMAPGSSARSEVLRGQKLGGGHEVSERGMAPAHPGAPRRGEATCSHGLRTRMFDE